MTDFTFTATAECGDCGKHLASSDADCGNCDGYEKREYHFHHLSSDYQVTVRAITPVRAWAELREKVGASPDEILPWRCYESGATSMHMKQMGRDVLNEDDLRQTSLP